MAFYYFDASAVVKYFHQEPGTAWVRQLVDERESLNDSHTNAIFIADVGLAEVPAAFAILARSKRIGVAARDSMYDAFLNSIRTEFKLAEVTIDLAYAAGELTQKYPLKGYDAVQLAVALDLNAALKEQDVFSVFVSGDDALLQAARAEGLVTENPFDHRDLDATL